MLPQRRDYRFELPANRLADWHPDGLPVSHFFNALSIFFPRGERFFVNSVRNYQARVKAPQLLAAIRGFIGQEAMHGREHESYNRAMAAAGMAAPRLERLVTRLLDTAQRRAPRSFQLSITIALEHFTAILADRLLADPQLLGESEEQFKRLWLWHAQEEIEHKAVAFDVWNEVMGKGLRAQTERAAGMLVAGSAFIVLAATFTLVLMERDLARAPLHGRLRAYARLLAFLARPQGLLRNGVPALLAYFDPRFHPWQYDNSALLRRLEESERPLAYAA